MLPHTSMLKAVRVQFQAMPKTEVLMRIQLRGTPPRELTSRPHCHTWGIV
jgi:hypothetical protein